MYRILQSVISPLDTLNKATKHRIMNLKKILKTCFGFLHLLFYLLHNKMGFLSQWMIAQMAEQLLCTRRTRVQIPASAPYDITL